MSRRIEGIFSPPKAEDFRKYLLPKTIPPLDINALSLSVMDGATRSSLKIPSAGDWSLVLSYKNKEAYLASFIDEGNDHSSELKLVQLQGANTKRGYRVATGMNTLLFITDQIEKIISHPENPYSFLTMPPAVLIEGILDATEAAIVAYERAALRLKMNIEQERNLFVRNLKKSS